MLYLYLLMGCSIMLLKCEYCGKDYKTYISPRCEHHYCSRECSYKGRSSKQKFHCKQCDKEIYRQPNGKKIKQTYFCSVKCFNEWQGRNKLKFICKTCGKEFYRSPSWIKQKQGYYCSLICRNKDEQWKERSCFKANQIQCKKKGLNKLELNGNEILDMLELDYKVQHLINDKICVDVYVPKYNLIIQWDGDYWHGKDKSYEDLDYRVQKRVCLDKSQDAYFLECGFNELRFWESDVYKRKGYVYDTIERTIQQIARRI